MPPLILPVFFILFSCSIPNSFLGQNNKPYQNLQLKVRIIGSSAPGRPAFTQASNNSFPNEAEYLWNYGYVDQTDSKNYISIKDTSNKHEGFTSNGGRDLFIDYHTRDRMTAKYNGTATSLKVWLVFMNGPYNYGRDFAVFSIPSGLDPQTQIALYTIYFEHELYPLTPSITGSRSKVRTVFEGTEPKAATS